MLLYIRDHSDQGWTAGNIAAELRATESAIELRLEDLAGRGLVARTPDARYRYAPGRSDDVVTKLAEVYRVRRTTVIQAIFSGPSDAVRSFADAFLLGPEEEEEDG